MNTLSVHQHEAKSKAPHKRCHVDRMNNTLTAIPKQSQSFFFFPLAALQSFQDLFPQPGTEPRPRQWKPQVLITMPPGNFQGLWDSSHSQSSPRSYICHQNEAVHGLKGLVLGMMKTCRKKSEKKMQKSIKNFYHLFLEFIDKIHAELLFTEANLRKNFMLNKNGFPICFL